MYSAHIIIYYRMHSVYTQTIPQIVYYKSKYSRQTSQIFQTSLIVDSPNVLGLFYI